MKSRRKRIRITTEITKRQFIFLMGCLVILMAVFVLSVSLEGRSQSRSKDTEEKYSSVEVVNTPTEVQIEPSVFPEYVQYEDPNNYIYPFNTMSADWGAELYSSGFRYYQIPQEYIDEGGCFPEVVQAYLWSLCHEKGIDYYIVVALIERESRYKWDASGDNGNSKGYMQIYEKWHLDRMKEEGVTDLYNPYGNIRVGLNFLYELSDAGETDYHYVLMSYNMGESRAKEFYSKGIYSTAYSTEILQRAIEIQTELQEIQE